MQFGRNRKLLIEKIGQEAYDNLQRDWKRKVLLHRIGLCVAYLTLVVIPCAIGLFVLINGG